MELLDYLRTYGLEKLKEEFKIKATFSQKHPNLVCLKYNQIDSPMKEKVVQQCRGIILDTEDDWKVVSYPYDKFFNYGEGDGVTTYHEKVDWDTAKVYEKLDGSLMTLYFYKGEWLVQSSSNPDGSGRVNGFDFTFAELFWKVFKELDYPTPDLNEFGDVSSCPNFDRRHCYMFELITKYNRIVVPVDKNRLVLHGVRDLTTFRERPVSSYGYYGWEIVKQFPLSGWESVVSTASTISPTESEGYVVCDSDFNRVKVKSPLYVAMHHLKSSASPRNMLKVVMSNEGSELLTHFPEMTDEYNTLKDKYQQLVDSADIVWHSCKSIETQRDFALAVKDYKFSGVLFEMRKGKYQTVAEALGATRVEYIEGMIK